MSIEFPEAELGEMQTADERLEMRQQIEAANKAVDTMNQGIETRKELIAMYQAKLENDGTHDAPEESNYRSLANADKLKYLELIGEQGAVITEYESSRDNFKSIIKKLEDRLNTPEISHSLNELNAIYGEEFRDSRKSDPQGLEIHVDRPEN